MSKNKKTNIQKTLKNIGKFFVNGEPMSQIVHWTIILATSGIFAINIVRAANMVETII